MSFTTQSQQESYGIIPGNKPNKWAQVTSRKHATGQKSELSVGWNQFYNTDHKEKPQNRRIIPAKRSQTTLEDLKAGKRCFEQLKPVEDRRTGMKMVQGPKVTEYKRPERRHVQPSWVQYKKETASSLVNSGNYSCGLEKPTRNASSSSDLKNSSSLGRHLVTNEQGELISTQRGNEMPISAEMARKKLVDDSRNGIGVAAPGDKSYKQSDHSSGYHNGKHTKPRKVSTDVSAFEPTVTQSDHQAHQRLMKPQRQKMREQQKQSDINMVKALDSFNPSEA